MKPRLLALAALVFLLASCGSEPAATKIPAAPLLTFQGTADNQSLALCYFESKYTLTVGEVTFTVPLRDTLRADTVEHGFEIADVNLDGHEDILIELGLYGHITPMDCFVYTPEGYRRVPGFDELSIPRWSNTLGMIINEWNVGPGDYGIERYRLNGTDLILEESLTWNYETGNPLYTEKKRINGELVIVKDAVKESEVDLDAWYS